MTDREWFKAAFLYRCAERGLSVEETTRCAHAVAHTLGCFLGNTKTAQDEKSLAATLFKNVFYDIPKTLYSWGLTAGVPLSALGLAGGLFLPGYIGGNLAGNIVNAAKERDIEELKQQEIAEAYQRELDLMKLRSSLSTKPARRGRPLL